MSPIPNEQQCLDLLKAQGATDRVMKHVCTVTRLAVAMARSCGADTDLVRAGALLHDIGRSRTHGIQHGVVGEDIARSLSLPEPLVLIIRKHVGAGILPGEAAALGLPDRDYIPSTVEEKIVCHADNLVDDDRYISSQASYRDFVRKGLYDAGGRMLDMHEELSGLCGRDIDDIVQELTSRAERGPCSKYLDMRIDKWSE
ncbi:MAG: tRNA 2'-O-methylase [Methanomassiliicoccales archaeon PtaU1.Bin030]|nr:MAG: tRNA 2'-O-methylase [Methanomassiliicoccales archaeon PtaU1.Bin030]